MPGFKMEPGSAAGSRAVGLAPVPTSAYYTYTWEIGNLFGDANPGPTIFARDLTLPTWTANTETVQGASLTYKYANDIVWEDCRVTFYDIPLDSSADSLLGFIRRWRNRVHTIRGGIGFAEPSAAASDGGYKRPSRMFQYTNDNSKKVTWILSGSWPQSIKYGDLTYTTSDMKLVEVVITYDWANEFEE